MSVDVFQDKIRKTKNPSVILFEAIPDLLPPHILEQEGNIAAAVSRFCRELLEGLKGKVPAVRFGFGSFALLGQEGLGALSEALKLALKLKFYVLLDLPEILTPSAAQNAAAVMADSEVFPCNGVIVSTYLGSDVLQPMRGLCQKGKTVFAVARTSNKSAVELQDLMTGGRLVHTAAADVINRYGETMAGKFGYGQLGAVAAAGSAESLRTLRSKYSRLFLLLDGYDYPNGNAKNCSVAFDKFGHGAAVCAAGSVTGAWKENGSDGTDYVLCAQQAAEKMKKNLTRYVTVL